MKQILLWLVAIGLLFTAIMLLAGCSTQKQYYQVGGGCKISNNPVWKQR